MGIEKEIKLLAKYFTQQASLKELEQLSKWIEDPNNKDEFKAYAKINLSIDINMKEFDTDGSRKKLLKYIEQERKAASRRRLSPLVKYAAVAALLISLGILLENQFFGNDTIPQVDTVETNAVVDGNAIKGGAQEAILTLGDGSKVDLKKGKEIDIQGVTGNGEKLVYNSDKEVKVEVAYNFLTVPRGGQYQLELADGTMVWLNSESELKYPTRFVEGEPREVEVVYGEAYFVVSPSILHDGAAFKVLHKSQEIEVLGTEFNIKAYQDESNIYTTLVEGSVTVSAFGRTSSIQPGQQMNLNLSNNLFSLNEVDVRSEISWRWGLFGFKGKPLRDIAKVLERWYDIEIVFANPNMESIRFNGVLSKKEPIAEILNSMLTTNSIYAYEIEERTITIK